MSPDMTTLFITLQFLESAKREACQKNMDDYLECSRNRSVKFEDCYALHMEKFNQCIKSLEIIKQMSENDN